MEILRRVLGISSDAKDSSSTSEHEEIVITDDANTPVITSEPVIETPDKAGKSGTSGAAKGDAATLKPVTMEPPATPGEGDSKSEEKPADSQRVDLLVTRPLPPLESIVPQPGQRVTFGQLSDVGMVRGNNQDAMMSFLASSSSSESLPDVGMFIVADGMGGYHDGEKASAIAARVVMRHLMYEVFDQLLQDNLGGAERPTVMDVMREAVQKANVAVSAEIPEGGTTVTATVILGDLVYIAHVGDSRAYLITEDGIEQITRDHSLVQRLIELDQLTLEEAAEHPQRNVLYRAIGQSESLDVDAITRRLPPRSRLLLCSDGLWNLVSEDTILEVVYKHSNPQEVCNQLVEMANERGGPDNITVILVQMPG